jgi:hypothetical protein
MTHYTLMKEGHSPRLPVIQVMQSFETATSALHMKNSTATLPPLLRTGTKACHSTPLMYTNMRTKHHKCEEEERDTSPTVLVTKKRGVGVPPPRTGFCIFYSVTYMTDNKLKHAILVVATERISAGALKRNLNLIFSI